MKLSFDGIRTHLAYEFNDLVDTFDRLSKTEFLTSEQSRLIEQMREDLGEVRGSIGGLLAAYDPRDQPDDCNMLADRIKLADILEDGPVEEGREGDG